MLELDIAALAQFLRTTHWPALREEQPTFFSIAGIGHRELPLSNVYAFFFRSEAPHGAGTLFLRVLLDVVQAKATALVTAWPELAGPVQVAREYGVDNQQRLDLLVHDGATDSPLHGSSYAVLIENKVHHWLANDLDNYMTSVRGSMRKLGVVLGLRPERPEEPWVFVSHAELAKAVGLRLGPVLNQVNSRYLPVLLHLLEHLTQMSDQNDNFTLAFDFTQRHREQLAVAQRLLAQVKWQSLSIEVVQAFGEGYQKQVDFDDRVDIARQEGGPLRYIVFYGHILDIQKSPGFAITLYASGANKERVEAWRAYLRTIQPELAPLPWFPQSFEKLVIGKGNHFTGGTLEALRAQVRAALLSDWKPLEIAWTGMTQPPVIKSTE